MIRSELVEQSRLMMKEGSKSFAAASRLFDHATRERVWLLYAWCRRCDDLTDSQELGGTLGEQNDISAKVEYLRSMTAQALSGNETGDVAFDAFGLVASECGLTLADADAVIKGFQLDAEEWRPQDDYDLMRYCWHVAGAVGVMMALVMGVNRKDSDTLDKACDLGLAFQIADDILDATASVEELGKNPSDVELDKSTYVALFGIDEARARAGSEIERGLAALSSTGVASSELAALARFMVERGR